MSPQSKSVSTDPPRGLSAQGPPEDPCTVGGSAWPHLLPPLPFPALHFLPAPNRICPSLRPSLFPSCSILPSPQPRNHVPTFSVAGGLGMTETGGLLSHGVSAPGAQQSHILSLAGDPGSF